MSVADCRNPGGSSGIVMNSAGCPICIRVECRSAERIENYNEMCNTIPLSHGTDMMCESAYRYDSKTNNQHQPERVYRV